MWQLLSLRHTKLSLSYFRYVCSKERLLQQARNIQRSNRKEESMKCKLSHCLSQCCYNVPFENWELERFAALIVTPVKYTMPIGCGILPFTDEDPMKNKCPFLRKDYKCNIYDNRPDVCRKFGQIDELPCKFIRR